jgi:micrococcal nuclease
VVRRRWWLPLLLLSLVLASAAPAQTDDCAVTHVVDGDTIHVQCGARVEKVRYIGIDAPEIHPSRGAPRSAGPQPRDDLWRALPFWGEEPGGREATALNRRLVGGRHVRLELDVRARDQYGRLLAYVWVGDLLVNAELVRLGYAQVMTVPPNVRYQALFVKLQREARAAGRGLWAASSPTP